MAAVEGPFCFAVADYEDAWVGHFSGLFVYTCIEGRDDASRCFQLQEKGMNRYALERNSAE